MYRLSIPFRRPLSGSLLRRRLSSILMFLLWMMQIPTQAEDRVTVDEIFQRVRQHSFHPLNEEGTFTLDRELKKHGVADLDDRDWRVRLLAIRDLVGVLPDASGDVERGLRDGNLHVRQIAAASLGIARVTNSRGALEKLLQTDESALVRCQAAMSLGQMESESSLDLLKKRQKEETSRDVLHQCELAIGQINKKLGASDELQQAYRNLNPEDFARVRAGEKAPDFVLRDTKGVPWKLSNVNEDRWVILIWIFADWCPVCHGEFRDLINMQKKFQKAGVQIATIECHDTFRGRVMTAQELAPDYWFAKQSFQEIYLDKIWWPHLLDRASAVGTKYGVNPMCFAVHGEYINRPSTVIIDPKGVVRFAYFGTYWGDRPTIHQTLKMIETEDFEFEHPDRRMN